MIDYEAVRATNLKRLVGDGFTVSPSLPFGPRGETNQLRPVEEIAKRLWGLNALYFYVCFSGRDFPTREIRNCIERNSLASQLTSDENDLLRGWRWLTRRKHVDSIGWYLENMLSLSWVLGFDIAPSLDGQMLQGALLEKMLVEFIGDTDASFADWIHSNSLRDENDVIAMEDLFYCAHNAVRSAQLGRDTVPEDFHPVVNGGVIHERRHALTWVVSPDTHWDDTDLST